MKDITFKGIDSDIETSLFEYGFIMSNEEHEDGSGTHFVIYRQYNPLGEGKDEFLFGSGHISESQIDGYVEGKEFMDETDTRDFLNFLGELTPENWKEQSMEQKFFDLINYWGIENIMGTDYWPLDENFIRKTYLNTV